MLPADAELFDDKKSAYELASIGQSSEEKRKTLEDYAVSLEEQTADSVLIGNGNDEKAGDESFEKPVRSSAGRGTSALYPKIVSPFVSPSFSEEGEKIR